MRAVRRLESHAAVTQAATLPPPPAPPPARRLSPEAEERKPAITINYLSPPRHRHVNVVKTDKKVGDP